MYRLWLERRSFIQQHPTGESAKFRFYLEITQSKFPGLLSLKSNTPIPSNNVKFKVAPSQLKRSVWRLVYVEAQRGKREHRIGTSA
jgi:hypothetical protein